MVFSQANSSVWGAFTTTKPTTQTISAWEAHADIVLPYSRSFFTVLETQFWIQELFFLLCIILKVNPCSQT
jgi:hypothetical protein